MKHTIQVLVENKFGVLARIASLFSARGYNINSLAVGETQDPTLSCMTLVVEAEDERILEQIKKQLHKLIDVVTVVDLTHQDHFDRELILMKVVPTEESKPIVEDLTKNHSVQVLDQNEDSVLLQACADHRAIEDILSLAQKTQIKEVVRTGKIAISK